LYPGDRPEMKSANEAAKTMAASIVAKHAPMHTRGPLPNGKKA
jgi:hypothetical protein